MQPQSYTPLTAGQTPTLGTSGDAVRALQTNYNVTNPTATPLKIDGLYGPITNAALNPNKIVVSGKDAMTQFNTHSSNLDNMLAGLNAKPVGGEKPVPTIGNTNDPYTQMLDRMTNTSDLATKALINTIQAQRSSRGATIDSQYENYKRGLQSLGIQHNQAQATPDLLMGHIQQAENEHQQKLQALDVEMNKALIDAQQAKDTRDLSTLKEKMAYIKDLKTEQQNLLKNVADQMGYQTKIAETQAGQYYDALQKLNPKDKEAFLVAVSQKFNIPLGSLVQGIQTEKERRDKLALEAENTRSLITERGKKASGGEKILTPSVINTLKKANPMIDISYGDSSADGQLAVANAQAIKKGIQLASQNPELVDNRGLFRAEYIKNALDNLPVGISRTGFLTTIKDKLYLKKYKYAKNYGITQDEFDALTQ